MALYQLTSGSLIVRKADQASIPADPANNDYQAYLAWLAAGNTPDPAPAVVKPTTIPVAAFWSRFTPAEQTAIQAAANTTPSIAHAMTFALAAGQINLSSGAIVTSWIPALVAAGLLTQARATAVLTP